MSGKAIVAKKLVPNDHGLTLEMRHNNLKLIADKTLAPISRKIGVEMPAVERYLSSKNHHLLVIGNHSSKPLKLVKKIIETLEENCAITFRDRIQENAHPGVCDEQLFINCYTDHTKISLLLNSKR